MTNRSQGTEAKGAAASTATQVSALDDLSLTPVAKDRIRAPLRHALTTPQNRKAAAAPSVGSSLRRVHFSPHNEEFHSGMTPQSSPSRAQRKPLARSILKRTPASAVSSQSQKPSSRDGQLGTNGLFEGLVSSPLNSDCGSQEPVARVLFNSTSAFPQIATQEDEQRRPSFAAALAAIVERLQPIQVEDEQQMTLAARIYNDLSGAIAKYSAGFSSAETHAPAKSLLAYIQRDLSSADMSKPLMLAVTKCVGCMLHIDKVCALVEPKAIEEILAAVLQQVSQKFDSDKSVCQTAVWCISMLRVPAASLQPVVPRLVKLCSSTLSKFETSTSAQFECLSAIEALLRRAPVATRDIYHTWLFSVFLCITSPIPGIRSKADTIVRHNIPWVAADLQKPDVDIHVQQFMEQHLGRVLLCTKRLLEQDEHILVARIWGMLITICAKHCMPKINDFLYVLEQCFNAKDPAVLVATLMQWRCLVYAFHIQKQLQHRKYIKLVLRPIIALLSQQDTPLEVRLACVRCWATMVYALGEHSGSLINSVIEVPALVQNDPSAEVREIVCRILAAMLNRFVLPKSKMPVFVLPQMIIGTTNLAAEGATSLANTHGPFSSESVYTGDHTNILSRYVVGLDTASPTVPILVGAAVSFVRASFDAERLVDQQFLDQLDRPRATKQQDYISFGGLCVVLAATLAQLEERSHGASMAAASVPAANGKPERVLRADTIQLCDIFFSNSRVDDITRGICLRLRTMLFGAINTHLRQILDFSLVAKNPVIKSNLIVPSFDISPEMCVRFELHMVPRISYRLGLDVVNLVSTLHYSYMVANKSEASGDGGGLESKVISILDALYGDMSSEEEYACSDCDIALMALSFMSRVIGDRSREGACSSSAQEVLVAIMSHIADRLGEEMRADPANARLLFGEVLALYGKLPLETHEALIMIVRKCCALVISDMSNAWLFMHGLISALSVCGRLVIVDDRFVDLFLIPVGDLLLPKISSHKNEALHCFELILILIAASARRWADKGSLDGLREVYNTGEGVVADDEQLFAKAGKLLEHVELTVRSVEADSLGSVFRLARGLVNVLRALCADDGDSACRPFDEQSLSLDIAGAIQAVENTCGAGSAKIVCELLKRLLRVTAPAQLAQETQDPKHNDADKQRCLDSLSNGPGLRDITQVKRSLSTMLDGDADELDADSCSSSFSSPQSRTESASESESESESDPALSKPKTSGIAIPLASGNSASADSTGGIEAPPSDSIDIPCRTLSSNAEDSGVPTCSTTSTSAESTPKRKKKKRGKRKQSVVISGMETTSDKREVVEDRQQSLGSEPSPENEHSCALKPNPCTWSTVEDALDWIEEKIEKEASAAEIGKLLLIQQRLAGIQLKLCKVIDQRLK